MTVPQWREFPGGIRERIQAIRTPNLAKSLTEGKDFDGEKADWIDQKSEVRSPRAEGGGQGSGGGGLSSGVKGRRLVDGEKLVGSCLPGRCS